MNSTKGFGIRCEVWTRWVRLGLRFSVYALQVHGARGCFWTQVSVRSLRSRRSQCFAVLCK